MIIDEKDILDPEYYDESSALAVLLVDGVCFPINGWLDYKKTPTCCICVLCSDTFFYACADLEPVMYADGEAHSEIIALYKLHKENPRWGSTKWVALKRGTQPIPGVKKRMIADGFWDEELESLKPFETNNLVTK